MPHCSSNSDKMGIVTQYLWTESYRRRIEGAVRRDDYDLAQRLAFEWAGLFANKFGLRANNWKFFKRDLVGTWFGRENRSFDSGWSNHDVLAYADSLAPRSARISVFPADIACHAISYSLNRRERGSWNSLLDDIDKEHPVEVFPVSPLTDLCFRLRVTGKADGIRGLDDRHVYEAGLGQAMYVFEAEQGQHPIVTAIFDGNGYSFGRSNAESSLYRFRNEVEQERVYQRIENGLRPLTRHNPELLGRCQGVMGSLGIGYTNIEGYYNPENDMYTVVDLDLPFDVAFMHKRQ